VFQKVGVTRSTLEKPRGYTHLLLLNPDNDSEIKMAEIVLVCRDGCKLVGYRYEFMGTEYAYFLFPKNDGTGRGHYKQVKPVLKNM
jgi:hypothetical protein